MKKLMILTLTLFLFAGTVEAQLRFGVKGGANVTDILTKNSLIDEVDVAFHYQFGLVAQYRLGDFAIQPELLYSEKGGTLKNAKASSYLTSSADLSAENPDICFVSKNIEIPVNLQYGIMFGKTRVFAQAGPYVSFMLDGLINKDKDVFESVNEEFEFNKFDFGLGFGAGVESHHFQLSAKYDYGLTPIGKETLNPVSEVNINPFFQMKNRNLSLSLTYLF